MATLCKKYHLQVDEPETLFVCGLSGWMSSASVCCVCVQGIMHHFAVMPRHVCGIPAESAQKLRPFHPHADMLCPGDQQSRAKP